WPRRLSRRYTLVRVYSFFFQAEDGIRDFHVTGVQTCALPICSRASPEPDRLRRFTPSTHTSPEVGRSSRLTQRIRVLFPAPDDPITPKIFPFGTWSETSARALISLFF